jgi:hypothetical protein
MCTYPNTLVNIFSEVGQVLREIQGGARLLFAHDFCVIDSRALYPSSESEIKVRSFKHPSRASQGMGVRLSLGRGVVWRVSTAM